MSILTFESFGLSPEMNQALQKMSYETPSPIQAAAIPVFLEGKDIIGQAQTGTGKTASFGIPIIEKIDINKREIQAVVICPTRELALQVAQEFRQLAKFKPSLSIVCVYGGDPIERQKRALDNRPQILVGTPGRMLDFLWRGTFHLNATTTIVLDEADEMLNMGFRDDIEKIFDFIPTPRQMVFFSATMPKAILELTKKYQVEPVHVKVAPKPAEVSQISQSFIEVSQKGKLQAVTRLIDQHDLKLALVFCNTKRHVDLLAKHLQMEGYAAEGLHGGKAQHQRERILGRFRKGSIKILVATDVAARGIEFAFVLFTLAASEGLIAAKTGQLIQLSVGFTLALTPLLAKLGGSVSCQLERKSAPLMFSDEPEPRLNDEAHVIITGFDEIAQEIAKVLEAEGIKYLAFDGDRERIAQARSKGFAVEYSDIHRPKTASLASLGRAKAVINLIDDPETSLYLADALKQINPELPMYAATHDATHFEALSRRNLTDVLVKDRATAGIIVGALLRKLAIDERRIQERLERLEREHPPLVLPVAATA